MNIDDILNEAIPTDFVEKDRLDLIFERQHRLALNYRDIELRNGLSYTGDMPVDLNDRFGQAKLKDFFWRVTEELTEAIDARRNHPHLPAHTFEELSDALHFLVEAYLLAGIPASYWSVPNDNRDKLEDLARFAYPFATFEQGVYEVIHSIGCASNCLKQRPWKTTHQLVDVGKFTNFLVKALPQLIGCFVYLGIDATAIFTVYWRKSEVNKFRIRSNY